MNDFQQMKRKIEEAGVITIWGHSIPDGDCYGSQIGLREIIRLAYPNKKVLAIGSGLPAFFARLSPMDEASEETIKQSLAIIVDVSCLRRVEDKRVFLARDFAKFDHHNPNKSGEEFPYLSYVDYHKVSCAEIIENFAFENRLKLNKLAAEALYLGILTDSGGFRFYGTNEATFASVKRLCDVGIDPISLRNIAFYESEEIKAFKAYLRGRVEKVGKVCYVYVTPEEYLRFGLTYEEAGSLVNSLEGVKNPSIYCLFTEDGKGEVRGELRSDKRFPVQPVATEFHGGGHLFAAGTTTYSKEESLRVVDRLNQVEQIKL